VVVGHDLGALSREGSRARRADPAGGPGDEDTLATQAGFHSRKILTL
jgi:hypothetical protein